MPNEEAPEKPERTGIDRRHVNRVQLAGRLHWDPERRTEDGEPVAALRIVTEDRWSDLEPHEVLVYGDLAEEVLARYPKDSQLLVFGYLRWKQKPRLVEVIADQIDPLLERSGEFQDMFREATPSQATARLDGLEVDERHGNYVFLFGLVDGQPVRQRRGERKTAFFRIVTRNRWRPETHDVIAYGDLAEEVLALYGDGADLMAEGHLHWADDPWGTLVVAERVDSDFEE